jgi:RimJ/RimL family protein N-acetyltransferase
VNVRRFTHEDATACARVFAAVAEEGRWILTEPPVDVAEFALRMQANPDPMWVLTDDDGRIVGHLGLHAVERAPGVLSLGMNVASDLRGRGGGRALLEAAIEHARAAEDIHRIELEVYPENGRAISLYTRCGFAVEGLMRERYLRADGTRRDILLMGLIVG